MAVDFLGSVAYHVHSVRSKLRSYDDGIDSQLPIRFRMNVVVLDVVRQSHKSLQIAHIRTFGYDRYGDDDVYIIAI